MIEIRLARKPDLREIVAMLADDELGQQRELLDDPLNDAYLRAFDEIELDPRQMLIVAELNASIVGTLQVSIIPGISRGGMSRGQLEAIRVSRPHRGKGIGEEMIRWAIEQCRHYGCGMVQLTSDKARNDAHGFYSSLGFVASHEGLKLRLD